jgi:NAD(P)-dependent dehydrogenase (short-subunit alcohol dehydrogenase family)
MDLHLTGHTVLITGAASGIGLATARAFAEERCSLLLWDCSRQVHQVAQEIAGTSQVAASSSLVDVADFANVQRALQESLGQGLAVEHVVHCAAVGSGRFGFPFTNLSPADWPRTLEINVMGMVHLAHAVTPHLIQSRRGTFVFLASVAGQIGSHDPP